MELLQVKETIHIPQYGAELMISGKNPEVHFCDSKATAVQTDSSTSPDRK